MRMTSVPIAFTRACPASEPSRSAAGAWALGSPAASAFVVARPMMTGSPAFTFSETTSVNRPSEIPRAQLDLLGLAVGSERVDVGLWTPGPGLLPGGPPPAPAPCRVIAELAVGRGAGAPPGPAFCAIFAAFSSGRRRSLLLGPPAQRRVRNAKDVLHGRDVDRHVGRHRGFQREIGVGHLDDDGIGHDVLIDRRVQADLRDRSPELALGIGVDVESHRLRRP